MNPSNITFSFTPAQVSALLAVIKGSAPSLTTQQTAAAQMLLPAPGLRSPAGYDNIQQYQAAVYADARAAGILSDTGWQSNHIQNLLEAQTEANFNTFYSGPMSVAQALAADGATQNS